MNDNEKDDETLSSDDNYCMKGLAKFGRCLLTAFLVWCTFNYPMSDTMQTWFFVWAALTWITC